MRTPFTAGRGACWNLDFVKTGVSFIPPKDS